MIYWLADIEKWSKIDDTAAHPLNDWHLTGLYAWLTRGTQVQVPWWRFSLVLFQYWWEDLIIHSKSTIKVPWKCWAKKWQTSLFGYKTMPLGSIQGAFVGIGRTGGRGWKGKWWHIVLVKYLMHLSLIITLLSELIILPFHSDQEAWMTTADWR